MVDRKPLSTQTNKKPERAATDIDSDFQITGELPAKTTRRAVAEPSAKTIRTFEPTATVSEVARELEKNSCAIVRELVSPETMCAFADELAPHLEATKIGTIIESGLSTKRVDGVLGVSKTAVDLIMSPLVLGVAEAVLGPSCVHFQLSSTEAIQILPGETPTPLHRDDDLYPLKRPGPQYQIGSIWAVDDFTASNGGTRVIPGSHLWDDRRRPRDEQTLSVEMPRGSVLLLMGSTYHSGGQNESDAPRTGFVANFNLGWLRQEENQYLTVPREIAKQLPEDLQKLMGYRSQGRLLGHYVGMNPDWE